MPLERVARLLAGEGLLYARRGAAVPELTLVLRPADAAAGYATLGDLARSLAKRVGMRISSSTERGIEVIRLGDGAASISLGRVGDLLVATTASAGPGAFGAAGASLTAGAAFAAAAKRAGFEGRTSGLAYVDLLGLLALVESTGNGGAVPPRARRAVQAIDGIFVQTEVDGTTARVSGFVRVP